MLDSLIRAPFGNSLLLCSGYVQEDTGGRFKILYDLLPVIKTGCAGGTITTVAGKLDVTWEPRYRNFVARLQSAGLTVRPYCAPKKNWHAKIALRLDGDQPVAGIVGSSNLTRPAYDAPYDWWNFEGDILIWPPSPEFTDYFRSPDFVGHASIGVIDTILDPDVEQPSEKDQLSAIYRDIMSSELEPFK